MKRKSAKAIATEIKPRFRVMIGSEIALGPGKIQLLRGLEETGSIRQAAARMEMSYMRAWTLVRVMNRSFRTPLVRPVRGGNKGGGAELTPSGRKVLALYREMEDEALQAVAPTWARLKQQMRKSVE
jgi:molybdate transport system regulatory protein